MKLAVVLIHGIGDQKKDWAVKLTTDLKQKTCLRVNSLLNKTTPINVDEIITVTGVFWADVFQERQKNLRNKFETFLQNVPRKPLKLEGSFIQKIVQFFAWVIGEILKGFQGQVISEFVGDVIGYLHRDSQTLVHSHVTFALKEILSYQEFENKKIPITFLSHSLGTVIMSNYIYDLRKKGIPADLTNSFLVDNIFTVGSPIALFSVRYSDLNTFNEPIKVETPTGRWINIFDDDDPVGMPLKPFPAYDKEVFSDVIVEAGVYGLSHTKYFEKSETLDIVSKKLAIDWIALNDKLPKEEIEKLYQEYDSTVVKGSA